MGDFSLLLVALTFGLAGSFHCAGMCGAIALAMPLNTTSIYTRIKGAFIYNLGRAITYSLMGALFGLVSNGLELAGLQKWVSIGIGITMILSTIIPGLLNSIFNIESSGNLVVVKIKIKLGALIKKQNPGRLLFIGILNGLLPCGLVYLALAGALASGSIILGTLYMAVFGLGTIPVLFFISIIGNSLSISIRKKMTRVIPIIVIIIGLIYIIRGLTLGIPYLSPSDSKLKVGQITGTEIYKCCSQ